MAKSRSRLFADLAGGVASTGHISKTKLDPNTVSETDATVNFTGTLQKSGVPVVADANLNSFVTAFNLPTSDGAVNQVLKTDGSGNLTFVDAAAGGGGESIVTLKQDGDVTVHTGTARWYAPRDITITDVIMRVDTAPVGADLDITINRTGTQAGTTDMSITASNTKATHTTDFDLDADDYMTVDVTQIGSSTAGTDLKVTFRYVDQ